MTKRTKVEWQSLINQHSKSGLSAAEFCRQNKLDRKYFSLRKRSLLGESSNFVEVQPIPSESESNEWVNVRLIELSVPMSQLGSVLSMLTKP